MRNEGNWGTPAGPPRGPGGLIREVGSTLGAYLVGQIVVSLILTVLYAVGFALLGVPLWFLLAPVCGFLNLVPHFGPAIALILGLVVGFVGGMDWIRLAELVGVYVVVFTLEGYVITPRILGRRLRLRPLYVFLAVLLGGAMFGFLGLLLAVPVLAVSAVIYRYFSEPSAGTLPPARARVTGPPREAGEAPPREAQTVPPRRAGTDLPGDLAPDAGRQAEPGPPEQRIR